MTIQTYKCIGCGTTLQSDYPDAAGYVPKSAMDKEDIICKRCFRLKHYNEVQDVNISDDQFENIIRGLRDVNGLIVKVVDAYDIEGSWIEDLNHLIGRKDLILVINKMDILPHAMNHTRFKQWVYKRLKENGIKVLDIVLMSAIKGNGLTELMESIVKHQLDRDVYIIGTTNVGKSTLINKLIESSVGDKDVVTTSFFPGTTLDMIDIPLDENYFIFDTPGIVYPHQLSYYLSRDDLKLVTPKKEIKQRIFQLSSDQSVFIGGFARISVEFTTDDERLPFVFFQNNEIHLHRRKTEDSDAFWLEHIGGLLTPPTSSIKNLNDSLQTYRFNAGKERLDIVISGLGFITIPAYAAIEVTTLNRLKVESRISIFEG